MKKILILTSEEVAFHRRGRDLGGIFNPKELRDASIVLAQAEHNEDYFYIIKARDTLNGSFIHKVSVADFCMGKIVTLYNRSQTYRNEQHEWDDAEKEFETQMDEMMEEARRKNNSLNALHRMEIDD